MRWKKKDKHHPEDGEIRIITRFLFIPKYFEKEYRWLEIVKIQQRYAGVIIDYGNILGGYWVNVKWVDKE